MEKLRLLKDIALKSEWEYWLANRSPMDINTYAAFVAGWNAAQDNIVENFNISQQPQVENAAAL